LQFRRARQSREWAILNYPIYEIVKQNAVGIRNEYRADMRGGRTGYKTAYYEATIGWQRYFSGDIYSAGNRLLSRVQCSGVQRREAAGPHEFSSDLIWRY